MTDKIRAEFERIYKLPEYTRKTRAYVEKFETFTLGWQAEIATRPNVNKELVEALEYFVDDEPCDIDCNEHCQEHFSFYEGECKMVKFRRLLAKYNQNTALPCREVQEPELTGANHRRMVQGGSLPDVNKELVEALEGLTEDILRRSKHNADCKAVCSDNRAFHKAMDALAKHKDGAL